MGGDGRVQQEPDTSSILQQGPRQPHLQVEQDRRCLIRARHKSIQTEVLHVVRPNSVNCGKFPSANPASIGLGQSHAKVKFILVDTL